MSYLKELIESLSAMPGQAPRDPRIGVVGALPTEWPTQLPDRSTEEWRVPVPDNLRLTEAERQAVGAAHAVAAKARRVAEVEQRYAPQDRRGQDAVLRELNLRRVDRCPIHG